MSALVLALGAIGAALWALISIFLLVVTDADPGADGGPTS